MGYYTGSGVDTSGSSTVSLRSTGPAIGGAYYTYQRINSTVNVKRGVSEDTAKAARGEMNLDNFTWPGGMVEPACKGTKTSVGYTQINGSNLYELTTTTDVIEVRCKQGTYDSLWTP